MLGGFIAYHELFCDEGELITNGFDRARKKHPVFVCAGIVVTAAHLLRLFPQNVDPFTLVDSAYRKRKGSYA